MVEILSTWWRGREDANRDGGLSERDKGICCSVSFFFFFFFFFFCLFRAAPSAYGGSQARGLIRAIAASLSHSHSNVGSELHLRPTPQLMAMPDP